MHVCVRFYGNRCLPAVLASVQNGERRGRVSLVPAAAAALLCRQAKTPKSVRPSVRGLQHHCLQVTSWAARLALHISRNSLEVIK